LPASQLCSSVAVSRQRCRNAAWNYLQIQARNKSYRDQASPTGPVSKHHCKAAFTGCVPIIESSRSCY
jgi:hypothetical protein